MIDTKVLQEIKQGDDIMDIVCDICEEQKAVKIVLTLNYCAKCYDDYLAAVKRASSPYITNEKIGRIKTVHFPDSEFTMAFVFTRADCLSDEECIKQAEAKKKDMESSYTRGEATPPRQYKDRALQSSGKDEREEMCSD